MAINTLLNGIAFARLDQHASDATRGRGAILTLHHIRPYVAKAFAPNRILEITPEFLDALLTQLRDLNYDLVSFDEGLRRLALPEEEVQKHNRFIVLTLDDGYKDNAEYALPVFEKHAAPFTIFTCTGFVQGTAPLWWLDLEEAIARLDCIDLPLNEFGKTKRIACKTLHEKHKAWNVIYKSARSGAAHRLPAFITALATQAGFDPLERTRALCMNWTALKTIAAHPLCTIGAHTKTHMLLAKQDEDIARGEVMHPKACLEALLKRPIKYFSYPVGAKDAAGTREYHMAEEAGFAASVTTLPGVLKPHHATILQELPRISVNGMFQKTAHYRVLLSGLVFRG